MTAPRFRSTAAFSRRNRQAKIVDRATFVIFSLQGHRFAAPVESVERVLRGAPARDRGMAVVEHGGRRVPLLDLRTVLGFAREELPLQRHERTLVFTVQGAWIACAVDAVYEVATIDASTVELFATSATGDDSARPEAARARFSRHEHEVLVLDIVRVVRAVYEATQHDARDEASGALASRA
jgi:chemotaxis signal transduction protein